MSNARFWLGTWGMLAVLAVVDVTPAAAQAEATEFVQVLPVRDRAPTLMLRFPRADVQIERSEDRTVSVRTWTLPGAAGPLPHSRDLVTVRQNGPAILLEPTAPDGSGPAVAFRIRVPDGTIVEVRVERGDVRIIGVEGGLDIGTGRGDVTLEQVAGSAIVDVKNGNVSASFSSLAPELPSAFATLNGNVLLAIPATAAFNLDVRCRGCTLDPAGLGSQVELTTRLEGRGNDSIVSLTGAVNGGGPLLRVFTWNGEVGLRLRRQRD